MELSEEEENFTKIAKIVLDIVPKHLRKFFVDHWNNKFPTWQSDSASANFLLSKIPQSIKSKKENKRYLNELQIGKEEEWDTSALMFVLLFSNLNLFKDTLKIQKIHKIREIRNSAFAHAASLSCPTTNFTKIMTDIKDVAKSLFGNDAKDEIEKIETSQIKTKMAKQLQSRLDAEIQRNRDFEKLAKDLEEIKGRIVKVEGRVTTLEETVGNSSQRLQSYTETDIDELKDRYKVQYGKHKIHTVDVHRRIVMKEENVNKFAVKLKISKQRPTDETFKNEMIRYYEDLKDVTSKGIELSELFEHDDRVVLVKGVAGIGKSVLTKQLAFLWANNEIYTQFKLCIIMECREINNFDEKEGAALKRHELFNEFLKTKFNFQLEDGLSTLFILDGIDELIDFGNDDSVVWQLIDVKNTKYAMAKIILTGRPHVDGKLERQDRDIGGLQKYEIQGLNDEQIKDYINKFTSCEDDVVTINKAVDSSKEYIKIISVPQFLNSLCCVSILSGGKELKNAAELYVWVLYLLLKEHVERQGPCKKLASEIFGEYSSELKVLCEVCYDLLSKNKIIFEGNVKSRLLGSGKGTEFLEGLFTDISDNRAEKYQFKHLTLMEFLSAVHVCRMKNWMEIITDNLKNEFYQVVVFSCQLIGGCKYDGIIKDMFIHDDQVRAIEVEEELPCVLNLLGHKEQQRKQLLLFQLSIDIIVCFINREVTTKKFIITTFKILEWWMSRIYTVSMRKVGEICERLIKEFNVNEEDLKETFKNVLVPWVGIDDVKLLTYVKYLPRVNTIVLRGMKTNVLLIRNEVNAIAECQVVGIYKCELADDEIVNMGMEKYWKDKLTIDGCKLNEASFINLCNLVLASLFKVCNLGTIKKIEHSWWKYLADAIKNAKEKKNEMLALKELNIYNCTEMSEEMQMKIVQCGVELKIDSRKVNPPSPSASPSTSTSSSSARAILQQEGDDDIEDWVVISA